MSEQNYLQVHYLHHLPLAGTLNLGAFTLWSWSARRGQITDSRAREYLDRLFSQMLDYRGLPLKHIAVIVPDAATTFQPVPESTVRSIGDALAALFLCASIQNNSLGGAVSSDNFQLVTQNFQPGSDGWATSDGSYIHTTVGGLKLRDAGVRLPGWVPRPDRFRYDEPLLAACLRCFADPQSHLKVRIPRSLRWVANAYTNVEHFSYYNRILLLMIAFEILADQPDSLTQTSFGAWLDQAWGGSPQSKRPLQQPWAVGKGPFGRVGWWGVEYYRFRNAIIHDGDPERLSVDDHAGREFFATGVQVFTECVKDLLRQEGHLAARTMSDDIIRAGMFLPKDDR